MDIGTTLALVVLCMALEAFFSGTEIAMISVNRIKVQTNAGGGDKNSQTAWEILKTPDRLFGATSIGTNLAVVTSSAVFTAYMISIFGNMGDLLSMLLLSPAILLFSEIIPKIIFQTHADRLAVAVITPLKFLLKLLSPLISLFTFLSSFILKNILRTEKIEPVTISREQLRQVFRPDNFKLLGLAERKMIHNIFNFGEITVEQCMAPLIQIYAIRDSATLLEAHKIANDVGFSRLPVYHERMVNLIGILNTFDLLTAPVDNTPITGLIRPAYYVPGNKKIEDLLKELQQRGLHMAFVVDEFGGCSGIITIEDVLEEIVGEIQDEYDEPEKVYEIYKDGGYLIDAGQHIDTINEQLNIILPTGNYETLAGLIIDKLKRIPAPGDQIIIENYRLTVKEASKRKINSVIVRKLQTEKAAANPSPGNTAAGAEAAP